MPQHGGHVIRLEFLSSFAMLDLVQTASDSVEHMAGLDEDALARVLLVAVRDEGPGFDPDALEDPLAPENLLKASGRGIFIIRNFMDDVDLYRAPEGGMEIRMVKRVNPAAPPEEESQQR